MRWRRKRPILGTRLHCPWIDEHPAHAWNRFGSYWCDGAGIQRLHFTLPGGGEHEDLPQTRPSDG